MDKTNKKFTTQNKKAKSELHPIIKKVTSIARKERLSYDQLRYIFKEVRKNLELKPNQKRKQKLPPTLTQVELETFYQTIEKAGNIQHEIMLKMLFYTNVRVSELVSIKLSDCDVENCKIFIEDGKGGKDRYVLFPKKYKDVLKLFTQGNRIYLFESNRRTKFTPRRIQQIVKGYREETKIEKKITPHTFRHQCLTYLTQQGLRDSQIQLISGHASKKTLEVYQHLSLQDVEDDYQQAMEKSWV